MPATTSPTTRSKGDETAKAAEAFAAYVELGPDRSLRKLAEDRVRQGYGNSTANVLRVLERWSADHHWQDRIIAARSEAAETMLREAADLDADTFLESSRLLNERMKYATREHADAIVKMRESVRKPAPKGGASVNVNISVEVRQLAERLAKELGDDAEALIREAEAIAAGEWEKVG